MTTTHTGSAARTATLMAIGSMSCVQVGLAASTHLFATVGPAGAAWLRLGWAGVVMLALVRPRLRTFSGTAIRTAVALGVVTAGITLLFMAAVARLPLGTASALEFLGPLGVAVARSGGRKALVWPALAGIGVVLMTEPWLGRVDPLGVCFAFCAAVCWAAYILLTQRVGDELSGIKGLAISMPVAGLVATFIAGPFVASSLTWQIVLWGLGLAILVPLVPFTLELMALRRLTASAFGTLMSLEPALALLVGLVLLRQIPTLLPVVGIGFVVLAGIGAERTGGRPVVVPEVLPEPAGVDGVARH